MFAAGPGNFTSASAPSATNEMLGVSEPASTAAEVLRVRGTLLAARRDTDLAERCFRENERADFLDASTPPLEPPDEEASQIGEVRLRE